MKRKIISLLLTVVMFTTLLPSIGAQVGVQANSTINVGDYIQMGRYYDEPILWRCVDIDENGPLMLADRILTIKAFDAGGRHKYADGTTQPEIYWDRTDYGSNLWETSNMRCWLNSTATAGNVTWLDGCPPTADNLWKDTIEKGWNAYANEKGFLAEGNFTVSEQNAIKSVTQKSLLNGIDVPKLGIGGTAIHDLNYSISTVVGNYDTAYYHNVTDDMFLLDVMQLNKVYQNSGTLGTNYYIGKPTQKSIDNSEYKGMLVSDYWYNWLRSPLGISALTRFVRRVNPDGFVRYSSLPNRGSYGARPAFYINLSSVIFKSGNGFEGSPYVVEGGNEAIPTVSATSTPIATEIPEPTADETPSPTATETPATTSAISIGDYVQMGRYYNEPILWRCVDIDENGPLMLADRILTIKAFDAAGDHTYADGTAQTDSYYRPSYGSNLWETSNIRCWLNSTATAGNVIWLDGCPPTYNKLFYGWNVYANEKGFLAEGNFTISEQNAIKSVIQKSLLDYMDVPKLSIGGTVTHIYNENISTIVQNYDTAYYHNVTDKMFLLDIKKLNKIYQNSSILGTNYYIGKPTQKSVYNSEYRPINLLTANYWSYSLRSPDDYSDSSALVRIVNSGGSVDESQAYVCDGVRPAFYINLSSQIFTSGSGTEGTPYVVEGGAIDKTTLEVAIALANTKLLISYGTISWNTMYAAHTAAMAVDANENSTVTDVANATSALISAINALILLGDVNFSGGINSADALMALQAASGRRVLTANQIVAADVTKNGSVNSADALMILQVASGRRTHF